MIIYAILFLILAILSLLYLKFKNYVPILMYHRIAEIPGDRNALPVEKFKEQLSYLADNGYHTITISQLSDYYQKKSPLPPKSVLLTFDDGYADNFSAALPLLTEKQMTAVVFPISNWIGKANKWENFNKQTTRTMNIDELQVWLDAGMEIYPHTKNHPFLTACNEVELATEVGECKNVLEKQFQRNMDFLCYPYGCFNDTVIEAVKKAGYRGAFAIFDHAPLWNINLFALPRIPIPARQPFWEFKLKVSGIHILFIALRKWERNLKMVIKNSTTLH